MIQTAKNLEETNHDFEIEEDILEDYKKLDEKCKIALEKIHTRKKKQNGQ